MPIMAIDQGTTSTRAIIFNDDGMPLASDQIEHEQIFPQAGWVEHDPMEIWHNTREVMGAAIAKSNLFVSDLQAVGITQQRETTVVWNKTTGLPVYNAIVWQDTPPRRSATNSRRRSASIPLRDHGVAAGHILLRAESALDPR